MYVAAGLNDDTINIYYSSNLTSVHGAISVDVGSNDQVNSVEFSPDSSTVAVAIGRDNANQGTNGEVTVYDVLTGTELYAINPNGEDLFYDLAHSPDGQYIALAGYSDIYIVNTTSRSTTWTFTNPAAVNSLAWSPDGNFISMCGGWEGQSASFDMYQYGSGSWNRIWQKTTTTSCASTTFSSDSSQVISGMYWYQADGATARVYDSYSGTQIDSFNGPRPGGCTSGNNNQCGVIYGVAWSPDSTHIVTAHGRNDEGVYYWFADIDEDNDGYNTTDQGDGVVDAFPSDGTQWDDTDDDGYGDNPAPANEPDACPTTPGTSTEDRYGCPDADGDGWSDEGDWAVLDPSQWVDADEDGYGDNYLFDLDEYQYHVNQSGDAFPNDPTQWNDTDGDGFGDNYANESWNTYRPPEWPGVAPPLRPTNPMSSRWTEHSTWTAMATGWATTPTATEPMRVQTLGVILNTIVWAARTPTATDTPIRRRVGPAQAIVSVLMRSPTTPRSGAMRTTMGLAATRMETNPTSAPTTPALPPLIESGALTATVMAIPTPATPSPTTPRSGPTGTVTTEATTPVETTPTPSRTTPASGRTATVTATATTPVASTATPSQPILPSGATKTATATATTRTVRTATSARSITASRRLS